MTRCALFREGATALLLRLISSLTSLLLTTSFSRPVSASYHPPVNLHARLFFSTHCESILYVLNSQPQFEMNGTDETHLSVATPGMPSSDKASNPLHLSKFDHEST
jgi:hypothetical protein